MLTFILRRLLLAVPLCLGVMTCLFILVELSPGNAADKYFTPETPPEVRAMIEKQLLLPAMARPWHAESMAGIPQTTR